MRNFAKSDMRWPALWRQCIAAWCPSQSGPAGVQLADYSGGVRHGSLTAMDPPTDWVPSAGKYSLDFDGTDDYVALPRSAALEAATLYSVSLWFYARSVTGAREYIAYRSTSVANTILFQIDTNGADLRFIARDDAGTIANATSTGGAATGVWTHAVGVRVGNNLELFKNGRSVATASAAVGATTPTVFTLGACFAGLGTPSLFVDGQIDDVRVYARAITGTEIALLARRRGIAYETQPFSSYRAAAAGGNRRRRVLLMGSQ